MNQIFVVAGLGLIMALVFALPFSVRWVEEELEAFLLFMGIAAVTMSGVWSPGLVKEALHEPLRISAAVLVFGILFRTFRLTVRAGVLALSARLGLPVFLFTLVTFLGLASSAITAFIAALVLVEVISVLQLDEATERKTVIVACYAIGLGAVLTPIGEPLSTIATSRLSGPPHDADFFFLARLLWPWVGAGILALALLASLLALGAREGVRGLTQDEAESGPTIAIRGVKAYVFVAALVLLGRGLSPLVERWITGLPVWALYWANTMSAALDNATLAAAEISPGMDAARIRAVLIALMVSGGMLIPGNIPNIIAAGKLGIKSDGPACRAARSCPADRLLRRCASGG